MANTIWNKIFSSSNVSDLDMETTILKPVEDMKMNDSSSFCQNMSGSRTLNNININVGGAAVVKPFGSKLPPITTPEVFARLNSDNITDFPALYASKRYTISKVLQHSLFGVVRVGYDLKTSQKVCIKLSIMNSARKGLSQCGIKVLEDVQQEAAILRYLTYTHPMKSSPPITPLSKRRKISDSTAMSLEEKYEHTNLDTKSNANVQQDGRKNIVQFVDELMDHEFHYLITEYVDGCDLFTLIERTLAAGSPTGDNQATDSGPRMSKNVIYNSTTTGVSEDLARHIYLQIIAALQYLHSCHVAHSDISIENICVTKDGIVKLIDFGLARMHPKSPNYSSFRSTHSPVQFNIVAPETLYFYSDSLSPSGDCAASFPCATRSDGFRGPIARPGKTQYFSPEVYADKPFDAYANDRYSSAIILYTLLTGRPPYFRPTANDGWFALLSRGEWLDPKQRKCGPGRLVWHHLSQDAVELMNGLIKYEPQRWNWENVMNCSWIQKPLNK